jgi:hypothetical protein
MLYGLPQKLLQAFRKYLLSNKAKFIYMNKAIFKIFLAAMLITGSAFFSGIHAQDPPPPPPPTGGQGGNQAGGAAPLDGGLSILIALGAAYGGKKMYDARKKLIG